jgi:glutamate N-acetyltransferase/amino-acid N-acetyltransferase
MLNWEQTTEAGITHPAGFRAAAVRCGLKTEGDDLALIISDIPASVAGVFTNNQVKASCVTHSSRVAASGSARAIVANAGNANCCNGAQGDLDNSQMAQSVANLFDIGLLEVCAASTGVIGKQLPLDLIEPGIRNGSAALDAGKETDIKVAKAIMTTDLAPKQFAVSFQPEGSDGAIRIGGVCKGSGMIAPQMGPPHATMLCFITTDAKVDAELLQYALVGAVSTTFNRITVDGDTSTNDMVLVLANGAGGVEITESNGFRDFQDGLERVCLHLAKEVARDGEGATKLVEIIVIGATRVDAAVQIGRTIAESPLVKTALFGCDPNWGRVLMAAGRAGIPFDVDKVQVHLGDICVFRNGTRADFDVAAAAAYMSRKEVQVSVDLGLGEASATFWTCDYSYDYIRINAEYHT